MRRLLKEHRHGVFMALMFVTVFCFAMYLDAHHEHAHYLATSTTSR
jgi:hypothetical protein